MATISFMIAAISSSCTWSLVFDDDAEEGEFAWLLSQDDSRDEDDVASAVAAAAAVDSVNDVVSLMLLMLTI